MKLRLCCTLMVVLFVSFQKVQARALSLEVVSTNSYSVTLLDLNPYHIPFFFRVDETLPSPSCLKLEDNTPFRFALDRSYGSDFLIYSRFIASGAAESELISDSKRKSPRSDGFNFNVGFTF